ncbi:Cyanovirin-N [Ascosphaera apis ARSEF 7405]|uniref:Cyanovirin-N n=1 Tax=Ascosphaera apis ARSEF 7405 TaxID=392613 RepID=A0A168BBY3_9EURO|nr:Cyanovirin-N [Ascosphaera apis ARSEF 7405]
MSFEHSAKDIKLHGHTLKAKLMKGNGELNEDDFDLDRVIGNSHGKLVWNSGGFSDSAKDISIQQGGPGKPVVLRCWAGDGEGGHNYVELNLGEKIANKDGHFHYTN